MGFGSPVFLFLYFSRFLWLNLAKANPFLIYRVEIMVLLHEASKMREVKCLVFEQMP